METVVKRLKFFITRKYNTASKHCENEGFLGVKDPNPNNDAIRADMGSAPWNEGRGAVRAAACPATMHSGVSALRMIRRGRGTAGHLYCRLRHPRKEYCSSSQAPARGRKLLAGTANVF